MSERFDAAYYARFYGDSSTAVHDAERIGRLGAGISGFCDWFGLPLRRALEVGAGIGLLRDWFRQHRPELEYVSTEYSEHAAARYDHQRLDLSQPSRVLSRGYDLVICQGVLQYLDDEAAARAIDNLGRACRGLLYLEAITKLDLQEVCDRELTDLEVHERPASFYRARLSRHFEQVGAGFWHRIGGPLVFYQLECAQPR